MADKFYLTGEDVLAVREMRTWWESYGRKRRRDSDHRRHLERPVSHQAIQLTAASLVHSSGSTQSTSSYGYDTANGSNGYSNIQWSTEPERGSWDKSGITHNSLSTYGRLEPSLTFPKGQWFLFGSLGIAQLTDPSTQPADIAGIAYFYEYGKQATVLGSSDITVEYDQRNWRQYPHRNHLELQTKSSTATYFGSLLNGVDAYATLAIPYLAFLDDSLGNSVNWHLHCGAVIDASTGVLDFRAIVSLGDHLSGVGSVPKVNVDLIETRLIAVHLSP